ncbi:MAG TPA: hypothetical protein VFF24_05260, partial [Acidimicrobiia bacterium]|nr:hypothetical protein [Acidimicrobiia bacterium]
MGVVEAHQVRVALAFGADLGVEQYDPDGVEQGDVDAVRHGGAGALGVGVGGLRFGGQDLAADHLFEPGPSNG